MEQLRLVVSFFTGKARTQRHLGRLSTRRARLSPSSQSSHQCLISEHIRDGPRARGEYGWLAGLSREAFENFPTVIQHVACIIISASAMAKRINLQ